MKKSFLICAAILCATVYPVTSRAAADVPGNLPVDAQVRVGRLDNGMRYYIKRHALPAERADFFIVHDVGALQEEDNQNGLAHFLEHMAFNGTKNFPGKELLNYLASIGVRFGYNVNAYTSRDRTVYNVSNVPMVRDGVVDSLLLIMHDWSYYISCDPQEIEDERGVIREEWRRGDDARSRMARMTAAVEFAGSKYAKRDVIGDPNIVNTFKRETLIDFYHKWYRPDLQAVIVVGDVDLDQMEAKIRQVMSSIPKAENPTPKEDYTIALGDKPRFAIISDPETKAVGAKLIFRQPYPTAAERETTAPMRDNFVRTIFLEAVRARFADAEKRPDVGYKRVVAVCGVTGTSFNTFQMTAVPKEKDAVGALREMFRDVEQIRRYGFTQTEFDAAKTRVERAEKQNIGKYRQATNTDWASTLVEHFTRNIPYLTVEERERITGELLSGITLADLNRAKDAMTSEPSMLVIISIPEADKKDMPSEEQVFALMDSVGKTTIAPLATTSKADQPLFTKQVTPGKVVKSVKSAFGAEEWTLSNGVKVFWRTVPEITGERKFGLIAVNEGGYNRNQDIEGLRLLENYTRVMGVKDLDRNDVREFTTDHSMMLNLSLGMTCSAIKGSTTLDNAEQMLQLMHLYMTDPNFNEEPYGKFIEQCRETLKKERTPKAIYADSTSLVQYGNIPWLKKTTLSTLDRVDVKTAATLYREQFGNPAEFVFYLVGEMTPAQARPLVEKYIGSLPVAPVQQCADFDFEILPGVKSYEYVATGSKIPKAEIERTYHGKFEYSAQNYAVMRYLIYILNSRYMQTVREEKGGTYSISVQDEVGARPQGYCHVVVAFNTDPKLTTMLLEEVEKGFADLATNAPTEQEVTEARLYFQKANTEKKAQNLKSVGYWLQKMESKYSTGVDLDKDNPAIFSSVTPQQVQQLAQSIYAQGNCFTSIFTQK